MTKKRYSELIRIPDFLDRFLYLKLNGSVGVETFGMDRYLNQRFYQSLLWKQIRDKVIIRDNGMDMGVDGFPISGRVLVHHMNPFSVTELTKFDPDILNPEYLISVSEKTHLALHYGDESLLPLLPPDRFKNDTILW